jgi:hypothetical protein
VWRRDSHQFTRVIEYAIDDARHCEDATDDGEDRRDESAEWHAMSRHAHHEWTHLNTTRTSTEHRDSGIHADERRHTNRRNDHDEARIRPARVQVPAARLVV